MSKEMTGADCGVTILGRSGLRYREGSRTVFVDGEMLTGPFDFVVYIDSIKAWEGSNEPLGDDDKKRIQANIEAVCRQNGLTVTFDK